MDKDRLLALARSLLRPKAPVAGLVVATSGALVAAVLALGAEGPLAWAAYAYSAWGLAVAVAWAARALPEARRRLLEGDGAASKLASDPRLRATVSLLGASALDLAYVAVNTAGAVAAQSGWLGALSFYYFALVLVNARLLAERWQARRRRLAGESEREARLSGLKAKRDSGLILLLVNIGLAVIVYHSQADDAVIAYPQFLIYGVALYAFVCLGAAIAGFASWSRHDDPAMSATKTLSLVKAVVSMYFLEVALLSEFGGGPSSMPAMTFWTALAACVAVLAIPLLSARSAARQISELRASGDAGDGGAGANSPQEPSSEE